MATKEARGTKRTCQNPECETRYYDLGRDPIVCPHCEAVYKLSPEQIAEAEVEDKVEPETAAPAAAGADGDDAGDGAEIEEDDALVSLEDAEEDTEDTTSDDDEEDNTFLESDDDEDGNVTEILGGTVSDDKDEET